MILNCSFVMFGMEFSLLSVYYVCATIKGF